jgi:hypothetical protein
MNGKEAAEMPGCGRRRKTKSRFSIAAHEPLEIAGPRFPHSRSPGHYRHGKVEIQTQDSHFPTAHSSLKIKNERRTQPPPVTLVFRLISGLENAYFPRVALTSPLNVCAMTSETAPFASRTKS